VYIDRRYRGRRRRSPAVILLFLLVLGGIGYLVTTRTNLFPNPLRPAMPSPTPTPSVLSYLAAAEDAYQAGRLAAAGEAYARVVELEPNNDDAFAWQAWLLILRGHPDQAIEKARQAVALRSSGYNLGILAMALDWNGEVEAALEAALQAVDKDPMLAETHAFLAEVYADQNNWTRSLQEAQYAVELNARSSIAQRNLGYVLERQGQFEAALSAYAAAAELTPQLGYIYIGAGNTYLALSDYEAALAQFQRAAGANPDSAPGFDALGRGALLAGDSDRAVSVLRQAVDIDPDYAPAHAHLGQVYYTRLNWEAAIESLQKSIELGVRSEQALYQLGWSYINLDDCQNAVVWLQKALEVNPASQPAQQGIRQCTGS